MKCNQWNRNSLKFVFTVIKFKVTLHRVNIWVQATVGIWECQLKFFFSVWIIQVREKFRDQQKQKMPNRLLGLNIGSPAAVWARWSARSWCVWVCVSGAAICCSTDLGFSVSDHSAPRTVSRLFSVNWSMTAAPSPTHVVTDIWGCHEPVGDVGRLRLQSLPVYWYHSLIDLQLITLSIRLND